LKRTIAGVIVGARSLDDRFTRLLTGAGASRHDPVSRLRAFRGLTECALSKRLAFPALRAAAGFSWGMSSS
jgi:hypothetical protein